MALHHEKQLETEICNYLSDHDWHYSPNDVGYDQERALFPEDRLRLA